MTKKLALTCPGCSTKLAASPDKAGKKFRCPKCRTPIQVPKVKSDPSDRSLEDDMAYPNLHNESNPSAKDSGYNLTNEASAYDEAEDIEDDIFSDDGVSYDLYDKPTPFRKRTRDLKSELAAEFLPRKGIPTDILRLVPKDEEFLFADNPSQAALILRMIPAALSSVVFFFGLMQTVGVLLGLPIAAVYGVVTLYATYLAWKTQYFCVTTRQLIVRAGWLNRHISLAPVKNIQMVNINTGIVDRWLGLNTVKFETAAAAGFGVMKSGVLTFKNIHSEDVLQAYSAALGR